ncbi:hypothetical protein KY311_03395 [Candidatus Woesearchaeota archaeon]|nr:hypothetical protein [Candidatus Woesearchaeota archaeon]
MKKDECCPKFNAKQWDGKTFNWKNKPFIKETIPTLFHIPFPPMIGKKIRRLWKLTFSAKANPPVKQWLVLFADPSPFKSEILMSVKKPVKGANNVTLTGTFMAKVFDGAYNAVPKFIKQMNAYLEKKKKKAKTYYVHYAYCPKCAKKYGHNHMILFAEV